MSECARTLSISDTVVETIHLVSPTHINPLGTLHGGTALRWIITAGSMASMRVARKPVLVAHMDNVFFLNPVRLGMNAVVTAWVEYVGRSSMELTVLLEEENPLTGDRILTTAAHLTYVAVGSDLRPRPVGACIQPKGDIEEELYRRALERRKSRTRRRDADNIDPPRPLAPGLAREASKLVNPEDTLAYNAMHGGNLMKIMDELSGIVGMSLARGPVVTAAVDATDFLTPILAGEILTVYAAITYVGRTSMEVTVKAVKENPKTGERKHAATSYFTMVHLGRDGKPSPVPKPEVREEWQLQLAREAEARRRRRKELLEYFRREITRIKPPHARRL